MSKTAKLVRAIAVSLVGALPLIGVGLGSEANARGREFLGSFKDWDAFLEKRDKGEKSCYMISVPKETAPKNVSRGQIYIIITHWPQAKIKSQFNAVLGYPVKPDSAGSVIIDGKPVKLFLSGDGAWAYNDKEDQQLTAAMKRGTSLVVKGVSQRGTETTDTYSLGGFTAAHNAITQACY